MSVEFNGLVSSKEILAQQDTMLEPTSASIWKDFTASPASIPDDEKQLYSLTSTINTNEESQTAGTQTTTVNEKKYYDGPTPTGQNLVKIANEYHLPTSLSESLNDAQDAVLGITRDLTKSGEERKSLLEIISQDNRLRGIGLVLICVACVTSILILLAKT